MRFPISFFLAFATVSLAVPFRDTSHDAVLRTAHLNKLVRANLDFSLSDRQADDNGPGDDGSDAVDVPVIGDLGDIGFIPASSGEGLTGDTCSSDAECTVPRTCSPTPGGGLCISDPPVLCTSDTDCVDGEVCVAIEAGILCVSEPVVQANLPANEPSTTTSDGPTEAPVTTAPSTTDVAPTTGATDTNGASSIPDEPTSAGEATEDNSVPVNPISGAGDPNAVLLTPTPGVGEGSNGSGRAGLTLDPCSNADDCSGTRSCVSAGSGSTCSDDDDCRCLPAGAPTVCKNDSDCDEGEGCFDDQDILDDANIPFADLLPENLLPDTISICVSREARDDAVCIGSHSLGHISREELVFEKDAIAHVLCDLNDSCATPGHMVQYKGKGMMMKSYCELTSCVRKVMTVNSPKYRRGLIVPSHTDDLVFTALAARFQSRAEEGVLSTAVRFGF